MFLIHDNQPKWFDRRKNCRTRADHTLARPCRILLPFIMTFAGRKMTVQHRHHVLSGLVLNRALKRSTVCGVSEISGTKTIAPLPCSNACAIARHFGFPTPCYSVQQEKIAGIPVNLLQSCSLFGIQVQWLGGDDFLVGVGIAFGNLWGNFHEALVLQLAHGLGSGAGGCSSCMASDRFSSIT